MNKEDYMLGCLLIQSYKYKFRISKDYSLVDNASYIHRPNGSYIKSFKIKYVSDKAKYGNSYTVNLYPNDLTRDLLIIQTKCLDFYLIPSVVFDEWDKKQTTTTVTKHGKYEIFRNNWDLLDVPNEILNRKFKGFA